MFRFGLVGAGTHGLRAVIPAFETSAGCRLEAVADTSPARLDALPPSLRRYASLEAMLASEALDGVYIATLPDTHCELALACFRHGLHVICEKPLATTLEEAQRMAEAALAARRELVVMFEYRFLPHYEKIREWIASGRIGRVEAIHLQQLRKHPVAQPRRTNLLNAAGSLDCGIHRLDLARFWTGGARWETVHALGTWFEEPVKKPPHISILARLANGVMVTLNESFSYGYRLKRMPYTFSKNSLAIVGSHGVIHDVGGGRAGYELVTQEGSETVPFIKTSHRDEIPKVLDAFARFLNGRDDARLAFAEDGLEAQRIVDQANRDACISRADDSSFHHHPATLALS
ncbi:MAG TPA: Gfo/Idh/MocA family oxidoreductase [Chthoniobacteraceae bacterium]|nr:Gfo/Idh/MocA family oxidoreductase [Chthoniobacteraceae bacterium]